MSSHSDTAHSNCQETEDEDQSPIYHEHERFNGILPAFGCGIYPCHWSDHNLGVICCILWCRFRQSSQSGWWSLRLVSSRLQMHTSSASARGASVSSRCMIDMLTQWHGGYRAARADRTEKSQRWPASERQVACMYIFQLLCSSHTKKSQDRQHRSFCRLLYMDMSWRVLVNKQSKSFEAETQIDYVPPRDKCRALPDLFRLHESQGPKILH